MQERLEQDVRKLEGQKAGKKVAIKDLLVGQNPVGRESQGSGRKINPQCIHGQSTWQPDYHQE